MRKVLNTQELNQLVEKYPSMVDIVSHKGTIGDYYNQFKQKVKPPEVNRKDKLIKAIAYTAISIFGEDAKDVISKALETNYCISTAEHHASITYSETFNVALNQFVVQELHNLPLITLSCSTTTLDNGLYPRGVFYKDQKIPFLASSYKNHFVYKAPPIEPIRYQYKVETLIKEKAITVQEGEQLASWLDIQYKQLSCISSYRDQISLLNRNLWRAMIGEDLLYPNCDYYMIPAELVAANLLIDDCISNSPSWVFNTLFDPLYCERILNALDSVRICWDITQKKGTFLFWGFTPNDRPVALFLEEGYLVSTCKQVQIQMKPEVIVQALKEERIVPASSLVFLYIIFYGGLTCYGGILQVNYLRDIKEKLITNNPLGLTQLDLQVIENTPTNRYVNFQELPWTKGGLEKLNHPVTQHDFIDYKNYDHFCQIQECLEYLYSL